MRTDIAVPTLTMLRHPRHRGRDVHESHRPSHASSAPFRKARSWLSGRLVAEHTEGKTRPETWCNILLGCWICDSLTGSPGRTFPRHIRDIGTALTPRGRRRKADWSKTPPTLKLIAASLFARHGIQVDFLHADTGYVRQAQTFLASLPRGKARDEIPFYEKSILMHRMGHMAKPRPATLTEVVRFAQALPLTDIGTGRERLLGLISSTTEFGQRTVALGAAGVWMKDLVLGFAMGALRKYELIAGCRWMRAACYLGMRGERLEACVEFLRLHQRPEGPFGYYDTAEQLALVKLPKIPLPFFIGTSINLPVTVECLWTLAEVTTPWRLFRQI